MILKKKTAYYLKNL